MADFDFGSFTDDAATRAIEPAITEATPGEVQGANVVSGAAALPLVKSANIISRTLPLSEQANVYSDTPMLDPTMFDKHANDGGPDLTPVSAEDAEAKRKAAGAYSMTPITAPVAASALQGMIDDHVAQQNRDSVIARNGNSILSGGVARFGVGALVSLADPLNDMAMMIPVAPEAWVAARLAQAGGVFGRAGVRAAVGGAQGAAGMAALQPLQYAQDQADHTDFDIGEALRQVAYGAVGGAILHPLGGALSDRMERLSYDTKMGALQTATADVMNGRPIDAAPILDAGEALHPPPAITGPGIKPIPTDWHLETEPGGADGYTKLMLKDEDGTVHYQAQIVEDSPGVYGLSQIENMSRAEKGIGPAFYREIADHVNDMGSKLYVGIDATDSAQAAHTVLDNAGALRRASPEEVMPDQSKSAALLGVPASEVRADLADRKIYEVLPRPKGDPAYPRTTDAEAAARDMAARRMTPSPDPEVTRADRLNQQAIDTAPKLEGQPSEDLAEVQKMLADVKEQYAGEVAAGRLQESEAVKTAGAGYDEMAKAHADYAMCLAARGG